MNTQSYIVIFACPTETLGQWPPDLFIVCVHFLKVNESLFYKETAESFYPESFQMCTFRVALT